MEILFQPNGKIMLEVQEKKHYRAHSLKHPPPPPVGKLQKSENCIYKNCNSDKCYCPIKEF